MTSMDVRSTTAFLLLIAAVSSCTVTTPLAPEAPAQPAPAASSEATIASAPIAVAAGPSIPVELYVMSECPFCPAAVEAMAGALRLVGQHAQFSLEYVGDVQSDGLASMHGDAEVAGDIAQICAAAVSPDKYLELVVCQNRSQGPIDSTWRACAEQTGVPVEPLSACIQGARGERLLAASFARARSRGVRGTPTIMINGRRHEGVRTPVAFARAICAALPSASQACAALPPPSPVNVTILGDSRCADCRADRHESMLRMRIEQPEIRVLDYASAEGRALYEAARPGLLPAIIFDPSLDADRDAAASFAGMVRTEGQYRVASVRANWNPRCADSGGCSLSGCSDTWACRKESPAKLELFMMSQCRFAAERVIQVRDLLKTLGPVDFSIDYIGDVNPNQTLSSMHGADEVAEDMRQLCAAKYYRPRNRFLDYVTCRSADYRSPDWRACTGKTTGIDPSVIQRCAEGPEGKTLLEASFRRSELLGIGSSPTFVANRKHKFGASDIPSIRRRFCEHNGSLKGCTEGAVNR